MKMIRWSTLDRTTKWRTRSPRDGLSGWESSSPRIKVEVDRHEVSIVVVIIIVCL